MKDKKEKEIVSLGNFKLFEDSYHRYERYFECPKCKSSLIVINDEYSKNNVANSIEGGELMNTEKIVLVCCKCDHTDILIRFLTKIKRDNQGLNLNLNREYDGYTNYKTI